MGDELLTREEIRNWRSRNFWRGLKYSLYAIPVGVVLPIASKALEEAGVSRGLPANVMHAAAMPLIFALTIIAGGWLLYRKQDSHEIMHERLLRQKMDRYQTVSRLSLVGIVALGFWLTFAMTMGIENFVNNPGRNSMPFMYAMVMALLTSVACHGIGYLRPAIRKGLNDELTKTLRRKSVVAGYFCVMVLLCATFAVSLFRPDLTLTLLLWLMFAGVSIPLIGFAFLEWRASRSG